MSSETRPLPIPDWMMIDAVRYATGRRTYQVSVTARWLREHWQEIPERAREVVRQDLEWEFGRDDEARERGDEHPPLGDDCDRAEWEQVRALWAPTPTESEGR